MKIPFCRHKNKQKTSSPFTSWNVYLYSSKTEVILVPFPPMLTVNFTAEPWLLIFAEDISYGVDRAKQRRICSCLRVVDGQGCPDEWNVAPTWVDVRTLKGTLKLKHLLWLITYSLILLFFFMNPSTVNHLLIITHSSEMSQKISEEQ